jgi:hypothetical protein
MWNFTQYYDDQLKKDEKGAHVARIGEMRNAYHILVGKTERKRPLGKPWAQIVIILKWILGI